MDKLKTHKKTIIITSIVTLLPIVIGLLLWNRLPNEVATHFDAHGVPDGWSSKLFAVLGFPFFLLFCHLLCIAATCADPKKQHIGDKIFKLILWICPAVSWFGTLATYGYELGWTKNISSLGTLLVGIIFLFVGNYLPKCRQNYTVGIKLPWTLHDEENWNRTHRLAGKLWMIGGVLLFIIALTGYNNIWIMLPIILILALIPAGYSFFYYIKHK